MLFLAISPLVLFVILILLRKIKLVWASLASLSITLVLSILVWKMDFSFIQSSFLKGTFIAVDILFIVFGALFFLETLRKSGIINSLCFYLEKISPDYRIQVILLAWFLEDFLEGTAGFGVPSAIVAPLLIGLGLSPILSVSIALLGNSASVVFGAAGTPIRVGFASLDITNIPLYSALINLVGFIVPVFILWAATFGQKDRKRQFFEVLPFAIFSGFAFVVPSVFIVFLGQEFPSILGSIIGLLLALLAIKLKLFIPKNIRSLQSLDPKTKIISPLKTFSPYILLIILLILGKFFLSDIGFTLNFGLKHTFSLFNLGLIFLIAAVPTIIFYQKEKTSSFKILFSSFIKSIEPFLIIAIISVMVQLMINSSQNSSGNISFLQIIALNLQTSSLPFLSPFIGAFGSFLTGSATISNIMFGNLLYHASIFLGLDPAKILSLEVVGASAGNMIALADILPALAVVGLRGQVREVLKRVFVPCMIYVFLVGLVGIIFVSL